MLAGAARIAFPFILGLGILWWMYRGTDWAQSFACVADARFWLPMSLSLLFGIVPQVLRALRWKMAIERNTTARPSRSRSARSSRSAWSTPS